MFINGKYYNHLISLRFNMFVNILIIFIVISFLINLIIVNILSKDSSILC